MIYLQNVKNYKITRKCQKKYIFAQTIFTHFLGQYPLHKQILHTFRDSIHYPFGKVRHLFLR